MVFRILLIALGAIRLERSLAQNFDPFTGGDGCYLGQEKRRKMAIGIYADHGFRKRIDQLYGVQAGKEDQYLEKVLQDYVAQVNEVFKAQFNIEFELKGLEPNFLLGTTQKGQHDFDQIPTVEKTKDGKKYFVCPDPTDPAKDLSSIDQFNLFRIWKSTKSSPLFWLLLTDCHPFNFEPGSHTVAVSFEKSLCKKDGAAALVTYIPTDVGETWASVAYVLGQSFGGVKSDNPGLMNRAIGTPAYNGYSPRLVNKNQLHLFTGRMQYDPTNKVPMCDTINRYLTGQTVTVQVQGGQTADLPTADCFTLTNTAYEWKSTLCSQTPGVACTCHCNGVGGGSWTSRVVCQNLITGQAAADEFCIYPKPAGTTEECNYALQNNGVDCPGINPPATCAGGTPNGVVEEGEECDLGPLSKCCSNCRPVTSGDCVKITKVRDAAFNFVDGVNNTKNYVFQGKNFAIYTDIDKQEFAEGTGFLQTIKGKWKNLDPFFYGGIDAVIQNTLPNHPKYGYFYMFKSGKVTEYNMDLGESYGWPKDIANSIFFSVEFSKGKPSAKNPIDAALSYGAVVWFFQGIEASKYTWGQLVQDVRYPLSVIQQFSLPREHFFNGPSAVIYYRNEGKVDFFSNTGVRIRWSAGGTVGVATPNEALGVATQSNANTIKCPLFCTSCVSSISCEVCDLGYELVSGTCYEKEFFFELIFKSFDNVETSYAEDIRLITETSLTQENWAKVPAVIDNGVQFGTNGVDYIKLVNPGRRHSLRDFEISFWIQFTDSRQSTLFTAVAKYNKLINLQIPITRLDDETFTISFVFGNTAVPHPMRCKINRFMHVIVGLEHEARTDSTPVKVASISIDGVIEKKNAVEVDDQGNMVSLSEFAELKDMQIGAESNSIVAVLDEFKIQNNDVPATSRFLNNSSRFNPSWLCIFLLVIFALFSFN